MKRIHSALVALLCLAFTTQVVYAQSYHEVSSIQGVDNYSPKNPNTLWYTTSSTATGVNYPWMEYALPLGNGELGCMVFGGVAHEELQFNEKTLWSGPANVVGAASGNRTFMNFGSLIIANKDASICDGVTDYVRYLDIEEGIAGVEFKNMNGTKQVRKYFSSAPDQVIAGQYKSEGADKLSLVFSLNPGEGINASEVVYEGNTASFSRIRGEYCFILWCDDRKVCGSPTCDGRRKCYDNCYSRWYNCGECR